MLDSSLHFLDQLREQYAAFPCITWPYFTTLIRSDVNPLASDGHCQFLSFVNQIHAFPLGRQLIQQLQLIGEVVYLRDENSELDYIVYVNTKTSQNIQIHSLPVFRPNGSAPTCLAPFSPLAFLPPLEQMVASRPMTSPPSSRK